jgi:hypothetical protein
MSCYRKGSKVFDTGLRRVVTVTDVTSIDYGHIYTVEGDHHTSESGCCDLHSLDPRTEGGRRNLKVVAQIEKLIGRLQ